MIDLYQAADLEADIDPHHQDALEDAERDFIHDFGTPFTPSSVPVADVPMLVTFSEIIAAQKTKYYCQIIFDTMGHAKSFSVEGADVVLNRRHPSIQQLEQIVVPKKLWSLLLHLAHHSRIAGDPGLTLMFSHLGRTYYWTLMTADIAYLFRSCLYARKRLRLIRREKPMHLFPTKKPFESVAVDLFGPMPKTKAGNLFILVMANRFKKLKEVVL